eukprot:1542262-Rhodomonas_salina.2
MQRSDVHVDACRQSTDCLFRFAALPSLLSGSAGHVLQWSASSSTSQCNLCILYSPTMSSLSWPLFWISLDIPSGTALSALRFRCRADDDFHDTRILNALVYLILHATSC